jgi:hypothetical protein
MMCAFGEFADDDGDNTSFAFVLYAHFAAAQHKFIKDPFSSRLVCSLPSFFIDYRSISV